MENQNNKILLIEENGDDRRKLQKEIESDSTILNCRGNIVDFIPRLLDDRFWDL